MKPNDDNMFKSTSNFILTLNGSNEIDALYLSEIINNTAKLALFASSEVSASSTSLRVQALQAGSFEIAFQAACFAIPSLILTNPEILKMAKAQVDIIKGYLDIQKHLGGKNPKKVEHNNGRTIIINGKDQRIETPSASVNVINNYYASESIAHIAKCVANNNPNGELILNTEDTVTTYSSEDIQRMAIPFEREKESIDEIENDTDTIRATLYIQSPDVLKGSQWKFRYMNRTIRAKILDIQFLKKSECRINIF